ncbi:MAG: hypothetical protein KC442_03470 [Thermomicrobiales bacterium]|nr:hypothetical protein [Thermomicrobiales bacterium]
MPDWVARIIRTLIQMLAGGAFTALFEQIARDAPPGITPYVLIISTLIVAAAQNALEEAGLLKPLLKPEDAKSAKA